MHTLINILGAVSLLLFGMEMVKQGIISAFNNDLKRIISRFTRKKSSAFAVGLGITAILQSSTATALTDYSDLEDRKSVEIRVMLSLL